MTIIGVLDFETNEIDLVRVDDETMDKYDGVVEEYLEYIGINSNNVCWQAFDGEVTIRVFNGKP